MRHRLWPLLAFAAAITLVAVPAFAADAVIVVSAPAAADVGSQVRVEATVTQAGEPVAGAELSLTYPTTFAGTSGYVELGRATTGSDGVASFLYIQRASDNGEMRVTYVGSEPLDVEPATFTIDVTSPTQQYRSRAGVLIPFLGGTSVITIIAGIWAVIVYAAYQLVVVGRRTETPTETPKISLASEGGSAWVATLLFGVTAVTAIGMVIVFLRAPLTHANLQIPEDYDRTPIVQVGETLPYTGVGLSDPRLASSGLSAWVGAGCAGCHGISAQGGAVGPALTRVGSLEGFTQIVRRGPRTMPAYPADVLPDSQVEVIYQWLALQGG